MPLADAPRGDAMPLAYHDLEAGDATELRALKEQISREVDFPCANYKEKYLRRRLAVRMRANGVHRYGDYGALLATDQGEYARLLDALTIHVSKFFRNPEVWQAVRESVLPEVYGLSRGRLHVWSAGCAGGEEPYSANMMLQEYARAEGELTERHRVLGTDMHRPVLEAARRAEYSSFALSDTPLAVREAWFSTGPPYRLHSEAMRQVSFRRVDLLRDPLPEKQHLIFCRNVVIYFDWPQHEQLFRRLHAALVPGGFLVLGKVEALAGEASRLFSTVSTRQRIFRKP